MSASTQTDLQAACGDLFARYPQAVEPINDSGTVRSMILLLTEGDDARFFILNSQDDGDGPLFDVRPWRAGPAARLDDETAPVPDWAVDAVTHGMPLPRDGSLYGWVDGGRVSTMIAFSARYTPETPVPSWSAMPNADLSEKNWAPFHGEYLIGPWLWEHFHAGRIVDLTPFIGGTQRIVYWVDTVKVTGSGSIAVTRDDLLASPDGWILPRGRYVFTEALKDGAPVPSLDDMLADPGKTDLGPRFRNF